MEVRMVQEPAVHGHAGREGLGGRRSEWLLAGLLMGLAAVLVFALPLVVPMRPVWGISASYLAGFNNSVATVAALGLSFAVLGATVWLRRRDRAAMLTAEESERIGWGFAAAVMAGSAVVLGICGRLVMASHERYLGDAGYFIERASAWHDTGWRLYAQMEFAYGPLLLLPEIWLSELLHCSMTAAYFLVLPVESVVGLGLLGYVLDELPIRRSLRRWALVLLAIGAITPHLGLNYTYLRFASPLAVLLFATRSRSAWWSAVGLSAGVLLELLISPELGLAMASGVLVYGVLRAWQAGWRWLGVAVVPLAVLAALLFTLGRPYLKMAASFTRGTLSLPVGPYPHILVLLFGLVWLAPVGMGRLVWLREQRSARWLAVYVVSLALLPAALGRCDPLHVMFNGVGVLLLSLVGVSRRSWRVRAAWVCCLAAMVAWEHRVNESLFAYRTAYTVKQTLLPHVPGGLRPLVTRLVAGRDPDVRRYLGSAREPEYELNMQELEGWVHGAPVATPVDISTTVEAELKQAHLYRPEYYAFRVDMMSPLAERRSIAEVNGYEWMLLPEGMHAGTTELPKNTGMFQGVNLHYRQRNPSLYVPGEVFIQDLHAQWSPVARFGGYVLYRHTVGGVAAR